MERNSRRDGTNPRALGTNPRKLGVNPCALGVNPTALEYHSPERVSALREALRLAVNSTLSRTLAPS